MRPTLGKGSRVSLSCPRLITVPLHGWLPSPAAAACTSVAALMPTAVNMPAARPPFESPRKNERLGRPGSQDESRARHHEGEQDLRVTHPCPWETQGAEETQWFHSSAESCPAAGLPRGHEASCLLVCIRALDCKLDTIDGSPVEHPPRMAAGRLGIPLPLQGTQEVEGPHTLLFCNPSRRTSDLPSAPQGHRLPDQRGCLGGDRTLTDE